MYKTCQGKEPEDTLLQTMKQSNIHALHAVATTLAEASTVEGTTAELSATQARSSVTFVS